MRRTIAFLLLGVLVTGFFLFGLAWMTSLQERGWSNDPQVFNRQVTFVAAILASVIGASVLNYALNCPRSPRVKVTETKHIPTFAERPDHPLRDRLLDG